MYLMGNNTTENVTINPKQFGITAPLVCFEKNIKIGRKPPK